MILHWYYPSDILDDFFGGLDPSLRVWGVHNTFFYGIVLGNTGDIISWYHRIVCGVFDVGCFSASPVLFFVFDQQSTRDWLVVYLPLWKIWLRQLGWWHSQYDGKVIKFMFQTNQNRFSEDFNFHWDPPQSQFPGRPRWHWLCLTGHRKKHWL